MSASPSAASAASARYTVVRPMRCPAERSLACRSWALMKVPAAASARRTVSWRAVTRWRALPRPAVVMIPLCLGEAPALAWPAIPPSPCAGRDLPPWLQMRAAEPGAGEGGQVGGGGRAGDGEEPDTERADRYPAGRGDCLVEAGEQQRPGDQHHHDDDPGADGRGKGCLLCGQPENRPEQDAGPRGAVRGAARGRVEGEEEDAEAEDPGEDVADDHVVGAAP